MELLTIQQVAEIQGVSVPLIKWYYLESTTSKIKLKYHKARGGKVNIDGDVYNLHGHLKKARVIILKSDLEEWQAKLLE